MSVEMPNQDTSLNLANADTDGIENIIPIPDLKSKTAEKDPQESLWAKYVLSPPPPTDKTKSNSCCVKDQRSPLSTKQQNESIKTESVPKFILDLWSPKTDAEVTTAANTVSSDQKDAAPCVSEVSAVSSTTRASSVVPQTSKVVDQSNKDVVEAGEITDSSYTEGCSTVSSSDVSSDSDVDQHTNVRGNNGKHGFGNTIGNLVRGVMRVHKGGVANNSNKKKSVIKRTLYSKDKHPPVTALLGVIKAEAASLEKQLKQLSLDAPILLCAKNNKDKKAEKKQEKASSEDLSKQLNSMVAQLHKLTMCMDNMQSMQMAAIPKISDVAGTTYIVFDTNILMHDLMLVHKCWSLIKKASDRHIGLLMPLEVVRELDYLKSNIFKPRGAAREAIRFLQEASRNVHYRGQREAELLCPERRRYDDDGIMDCMVLFMQAGADIIFCTRDKNFELRAVTEKILTISPSHLVDHLETLIETFNDEDDGREFGSPDYYTSHSRDVYKASQVPPPTQLSFVKALDDRQQSDRSDNKLASAAVESSSCSSSCGSYHVAETVQKGGKSYDDDSSCSSGGGSRTKIYPKPPERR